MSAAKQIVLTPCESSRIAAHGHCAETNTLALQFYRKGENGERVPGATYHYSGFPAEKYADLCDAESVGKFFGAAVNVKDKDGKPVYPYTKLEADAA